MPTYIFRDVRIPDDIQLHNTNPFLIGALGIPLFGPSVALVEILLSATENMCRLGPHTFVGATFDEYANGARMVDGAEQYTDRKFLNELVSELGKKNLIYGVVLRDPRAETLKQDRVLTTQEQLETLCNNPALQERTIIVPSPKFTMIAWQFSYELSQLKNIAELAGMLR